MREFYLFLTWDVFIMTAMFRELNIKVRLRVTICLFNFLPFNGDFYLFYTLILK